MLTKTQAEIMKKFVSKINQRFSIKEIAEALKKPYPLIHRSMQELIEERFILKDEKGFLYLNYKENHNELSYIEGLRARKVIFKDKILALFLRDAQEKLDIDFFILLIFGSYIEKSNPRDIDLLLIIENEKRINEVEKLITNLAENFTKPFHIQVISYKSAYEMFSKRDKINILNETLNKHILLFGAENYYRILKNAR